MLEFPAAAAAAVRSLDEHWNGKGQPDGLKGEAIPLLARIACVAQTVEVFHHDRGVDGRAPDAARAARALVRSAAGRRAARPPGRRRAVAAPRPGRRAGADLAPDDVVLVADDERLDRITEAFAQVIDAKSPYTFNHSSGVADYATRVGRGARPRRRRAARPCAAWRLLHDIGKLGVSSRILDKPSEADRRGVRGDPPPPGAHGGDPARACPAFAPLAADAAAHHERIDGRGYPAGLAGDAVTENARILAVADVFEALTADRPYRGPLPVDEALAIMRRDVGAAFCPRAFGALEAVVGDAPLALVA